MADGLEGGKNLPRQESPKEGAVAFQSQALFAAQKGLLFAESRWMDGNLIAFSALFIMHLWCLLLFFIYK